MSLAITEEHLASFRDVYHESRQIYLDIDDSAEHAPMNPVVRLEDRGEVEGIVWRLTSDLYSAEDTLLECPLEGFHDFFYEVYHDADYVPSLDDMRSFFETLHG
jgi:hypothetical protein